MKLPEALAAFVGRIVFREKGGERGRTGLVFDWSTYKSAQREALLDHFGDCEESDFGDLRDGDELKEEWMPFLLWCPDGLDDGLREQVAKQDKGNAKAKVVAFDREGDFPQFQAMWFLHESGRVVSIDCDGTFLPAKKADPLADDWKKLGLREARLSDLDDDGDGSSDDDEDDDFEDDDEDDEE